MGSDRSPAPSRVHPRDQTTSTPPCGVLPFTGRKYSDHLPVHRRRFRIERFSVESNASGGCSGPACPAAGKVNIHAAANVRFSRSTGADGTTLHCRRGQQRKARGLASCNHNAFLTAFGIHRAVREHVANVVFLSKRRRHSSTR